VRPGLFPGLFFARLGLYKARSAAGKGRVPVNNAGSIVAVEQSSVEVSVVVPVMNEADNVAPLVLEIVAALRGQGPSEIVFVDDGSTDGTIEALMTLKREVPNLRVISHQGNFGQSRAIRTGVRSATGKIIVTLDGDGQNDPADIPTLLAAFKNAGPKVAMVSGVRVKRQDKFSKRIASRFANRLRGKMLGDKAIDVGCGLKAFRRDVFLDLPYFDHMHRYLIALMQREGHEVEFVNVRHRHRQHGKSKYGVIDRALVGIADLRGVMWLKKRSRGIPAPKELA
jgi:dolichol-phosphate mannosyltransferase